MEACTAQRGMLILKCIAHGVSGHVAHLEPNRGSQNRSHGAAINAIEIAARDIGRLAAWQFEPHPLLGTTRAQVTQVSGGLQRNQVPDRCEFFVDLRTTPNLDHAAVAAELDAALESEVVVHSARYLPKHTADTHAIVRAALAANGRAKPVGSNTTSDWAFLGDLPAVKMGPGDTHRSHRPDEYLAATELDEGIACYTRLTHAFFEATA
jgi:acetylornithine deacetylase